jgi:adenine-specific DNA methylase
MSERYIERDFPIVQLNPLSMRERNSFYPVYTMHNWYARRSASIFRALLLACVLPYEDENGQRTDLMKEFFSSHVDDPRFLGEDGEPLKVLDPFMGGGTTIVEGARMGLAMTGVDYNPIAWFIVKGETTPVDLDELEAAYKRLAAKVKDELLELYKTPCPVTGDPADIIYGFWVKQGHCLDPACDGVTDLFKNYEVARKRGKATIHYLADVHCPHCAETFDWELNRCTITAGGPQIEGDLPQGSKRDGKLYAFGRQADGVDCPSCGNLIKEADLTSQPKKDKKKIPLHVLVDPTTGDFFEVRGGIPDEVTAPVSKHTFAPKNGTTQRGKFSCVKCGKQQRIVDAADAYGEPLPFKYYGIYAHTPHVGKNSGQARVDAEVAGLDTNNDKWFAPVSAFDQQKYADASREFERVADSLPIPHQEIYDGYNTNRLFVHQYRKWSQLFNDRHLLALGKLLKAIGEEEDADLRDALLGAFQSHLDNSSQLASYDITRNMLQRVTAAHDYRNPTSSSENNIWGIKYGRGPFSSCYDKYNNGLKYNDDAFYRDAEGRKIQIASSARSLVDLRHQSASGVEPAAQFFDLIVTDPPYAGSVQYAEMSDWFYVWLHQVLKEHYPEFEPEITLKSQEIIEDEQTKGPDEYFEMLTDAWRECHRVLKDDGILAFTFHHNEGDRWTGMLHSLFEAGFYLIAAYPTHSEALNSIVIQATKGITYDIIHVCKKRLDDPEPISWTRLRKLVREAAEEQLTQIESQSDVLPDPDVWMILLGKALQLFSLHYGQVIDSDGSTLDLDEALGRLSVLVRGVRGDTVALRPSLQDADGLSQIYFLYILGYPERGRDELHKSLQGYTQSVDDFEAADLVRKASKAGHIETTPPLERFASGKLDTSKRAPLVDKLHVLLGTLEAGEPIDALMKDWLGHWPAIADGLDLLAERESEPELVELARLARRAVDALGDQSEFMTQGQQSLFDS